MADEGRQPVAIRIARPYASEEAFLEQELDTLTRTSVVLIGAQARPQGVVLRFEVTLASGAPLLRGEGRVVGFKEHALGSEPGLTLRFTRLDPRSKALVDRAAAMRDARARGKAAPPAPTSSSSSVVDDATAATNALLEQTNVGPPPSMREPAPVAPTPAPPPARVEAPRPVRAPSAPPRTRRATPPPPPMHDAAPRTRAWGDEPASNTTTFDRESIERLQREHAGASAPESAASPATTSPADQDEGGTLIGASPFFAPAPPASVATPAPPATEAPPPVTAPPLTAPPITVAPVTASAPPETPPAITREAPVFAPPRSARGGAPPAPVAPPEDRAALLERLRTRARALSDARVREILDAGRA